MTRIGVTGHRLLAPASLPVLVKALADVIADVADFSDGPVEAVTSLAIGADQMVARLVLEAGGTITFVEPCRQVATTFAPDDVAEFERLRALSSVVAMPYDEASEEAFLAAGLEVLARSQVLIAVWDGEPGRGKGGTADVVEAASADPAKDVRIVWPDGASRA